MNWKSEPRHIKQRYFLSADVIDTIIGILKVNGGHVTIFFNELDDCVQGVHFKMGFAGVLIEFLQV